MNDTRSNRNGRSMARVGRRELLLGGLAAAGVAACGAAGSRAQRPDGSRTLGVALVGLGDYAQTQLAPALQKTKRCALRGIVTGTPAKVERWQRQYSIPDRNAYDYASLPRIADNAEIDVVYVVTPTALHAKFAIMAAEAGKHVWCEKPMALTVAECQSIIDACRKNHVQLSVGYRMHHEPNTQTVMRFAKDKPYGHIQSVHAIAGSEDNGDPSWRMQRKMGGGALYDMGVYGINAIRYSSGEEPVRVIRARQWSERPDVFREVDEISEFELELPSGAIGYGRASRHDSDNKLRVDAERGWYELEPMQAYTGVSGKTSDGKTLDKTVDSQQARQMDDEAAAILEGRAPMVPGEEGLRDVHIVNAIIESAQRGVSVEL